MLAIKSLRTGSWLTPERQRVYPALVLGASSFAILALFLTAHGLIDVFGRPLGADFSGVWVAGREVLAGTPTRPFNLAAHAASEAAAFGIPGNVLPWPYPPVFLVVAAGLARLPYLAALALWEGATLALYIVAVRQAAIASRIRARTLMVAALAFPAVADNAMHGQNGFLSAALLGLGALFVPGRPLLAGMLLGLLAYKPQFALMWPLALVASRQWRALGAAAATIVALLALTILAYGPAPWQAFVANLSFMRVVVLENGGLESYKLVSVFGAVRLLGGPLALAYAAQAIVALTAAVILVRIWSRPLDPQIKLAALAVASLLATPYSVDYDLVILGPALAGLVARGMNRGFAPFEISLLAAVWTMPLLARCTALALHLPLAALGLLMLLAGLAAWQRHDSHPSCQPSDGATHPSVDRHTCLSKL